MQYEFVKILGGPSSSATTQTHELELTNGAELLLLITIHNSEPVLSRMEAIRGVINFIHHEVTKEEVTFESLKSLLSGAVLPPQFDMVAVYRYETLVYVYVLGSVQVLLSRKGNISKLLEGNGTLKGASGYLKDGDSLIMSTAAFLSLIPVTELTAYVLKRQFAELEQDSTTRVEESETHGEAGIAFLLAGDTPSEEDVEPLGGHTAEPEEEKKHEEVSEDESEPDQEEESSLEEGEESELPEPSVDTLPDATAPAPLFAVAPALSLRDRLRRREPLYDARGRSTKLAVVGGVLIFFLGVSIFFGMRSQKAKKEADSVKAVVASAQEALSQAKSIASVNKVQARDLILEARGKVLGVKTEAEYPELSAVGDALTESLGDVAGVYEVAPTVFSDLSLISKETQADDIALSEEGIRVLSKNEKRVLTIELPGKRTESLSGTSVLSSPVLVGAYANRTFVVDGSGMYEVGQTQKKLFDLPGSSSDVLLTLFAGNVYLIQKSSNSIWRYPGSLGGFGDKSSWLAPDVTVDLSKASSVAVDGAIWVLSETGRLTKFMLGNPQTVNLHGLPSALSSHASLYTDDVAKYLYILDPDAKSLFVFEKTGELVATYSHEALGEASKVVVSEENKIMVLSAGSRLLSLPAKHIKN